MPLHEQLNVTPFQVDLGFCPDRDGREIAVGVVKATFLFDEAGRLRPAPKEEQLPVFLADAPHGDPETTSLRYASDLVPTRRGTDVAVVGHAYGRGKRSVEVGFRIGALEKILVVSGPRAWSSAGGFGSITHPLAFEKIPIRYELAFGGASQDPGQPTSKFPENPVGLGFGKTLAHGAPLPSVEYRDARFKAPGKPLRPASLGFIPSGWQPRARFAGTFDAAWERARRPLMPTDLDERFYNSVPQDQVLPTKLVGGERLALLNLHPEAETVVLTLPRLAFHAAFHVRDRVEALAMEADTLLVEPDQGRLAITFRASYPVGDEVLRLQRVVFRSATSPALALVR